MMDTNKLGEAKYISFLLIISLLLILDTSLEKLFGAESIVFRTIALLLGILFYPFIRKDFDRDEETDDEKAEEEEETEDKEDVKDNKTVVKDYSVEEEETEEDESGLARRFESAGAPYSDKRLWSKSNIKMNIPLTLLKNKPRKPTSGNIDRNQDVIKRTLQDFGIPVSMGEVRIGPTVTQYTFKPSKGISVARVKALSDDLALNLAVHPVRIEAPIPGKSLVGLEVPNQTKVLVSLKEVLSSISRTAKARQQ